MAKQKRMGRPPRTDRPTRISLLLPGALRSWLERRAASEGRSQGDVLAAALVLYRAQVTRRKGGTQ